MIRSANLSDAPTIAQIYNHYIIHSISTFEETIIDGKEMEQRMQKVLPGLPWLVYEQDSKVVGYAYAQQWKNRSAYRRSAEVSVYLDHKITLKGIGSQLYEELFRILIDDGFHVIIGGVSLPNVVSVRLHEKFGFEKVAHFKEVGHKFGKWIDVGYWEKVV